MTNKLAYASYVLTTLYPRTQNPKLLLSVINTLVLVHEQFNINTTITASMKKVQDAHKESPVVFSRNASLVMANEEYAMDVLTPLFAKQCLEHTKKMVEEC